MTRPCGKISVVVPVFNSEWYLLEALRSVAAQRCDDLEVLVVDDGSATRACADIATQAERETGLATRYIRQEHRGVGAARNRGVMDARGEFVAFLDSDDVFEPRKLALQLEMLQRLSSEYAFVTGGYECFVEGPAEDAKVVLPALLDGNLYSALLGRVPPVPWAPAAQLFRRAALVAVGGYDCALSYAEDRELLIRLSRSYKGATHRDVVYRRRVHNRSVSFTIDPERLLVDVLYLSESLRAADPQLSERVLRRMRREALLDAAGLALRHPANHARFARFLGMALRNGALAGNWPSWRALCAAYAAMLGKRLRGREAAGEDGRRAGWLEQ